MRIYLIICLLFISHFCFAQPDSTEKDSISLESTAQVITPKVREENVDTTAYTPQTIGGKINTLMPKLYYACFFLGGIILTMAFQFILRRGEVHGSARGKSNIQQLSVNHQKERINDLEDQKIQLLKERQFLKQRIQELETQISTMTVLNEEPVTSSVLAQPLESVEEDAPFTKEWEVSGKSMNPEAAKEPYKNVLYFSTPNLSGEFRGGTNTFDEGASIYKFSLISATEAFFEFCDNRSSVGLALNHRNDLILAVAEESNAFNPNASRIIIDDNQQGQAVLEGSFWKVTKKAKIKYI